MELRRIRREQAKRAWKEKNSGIKKRERQSFNEYWKDCQELLHGNKLTRLLKNRRK